MSYAIAPFMNLELGLLPILLAQDSAPIDGAAAAGINAGSLVLNLILYVVIAFFWQKIFTKVGVERPWFAWIPILNVYAAFQAGDEENPVLWTVLMLVPCVNIAAVVKLIIAWVNVAKKLGKSPWLLLLLLVPILGSIGVFGYFAFG
ncbi:MAG TPA: DUF5684 domain-containing protein [Chroococcidiopsis sp.]